MAHVRASRVIVTLGIGLRRCDQSESWDKSPNNSVDSGPRSRTHHLPLHHRTRARPIPVTVCHSPMAAVCAAADKRCPVALCRRQGTVNHAIGGHLL